MMDFSDAIVLIKSGIFVTRTGWKNQNAIAWISNELLMIDSVSGYQTYAALTSDDIMADDWTLTVPAFPRKQPR